MAEEGPVETPAKRLKLDCTEKEIDSSGQVDSQNRNDPEITAKSEIPAPDTGQESCASGNNNKSDKETELVDGSSMHVNNKDRSEDNKGSKSTDSDQNDVKDSKNASENDRDNDDEDDDDDAKSDASEMSGISDLSGEEAWRGRGDSLAWVYALMSDGVNPRAILKQILPDEASLPEDLDNLTLWKIVINLVSEPPPRKKLEKYNTLEDVIHLMKTCENILVLTGAGVSVSCGIPDFRSKNGIYSRLAVDFPDLPDPQAMFDIRYFRNEQRPFYKFAKEIYPGQFEPSKCHKFIKLIEQHGKLLRNYTQNIDTLEQVAGIKNIIQCHGSFATATCMACKHKCSSDDIKDDIMNQVIPRCPVCQADTPLAVMKPDIVFFGESLPEEFHDQMARDKDKCDLLIVIGSSLKVRPVALIPNSLPAEVPQILINKERLRNLNFDIELLGDCDTVIGELCWRLGQEWTELAGSEPMNQLSQDDLPTPTASPSPEDNTNQTEREAADRKVESDNQTKTGSNGEKARIEEDKKDIMETNTSELSENVIEGNSGTNSESGSQVNKIEKENCPMELGDDRGDGEKNKPEQSKNQNENSVDHVNTKPGECVDSGNDTSQPGPSSEGENGSGEPAGGTSSSDDQPVPLEVTRSWWRPAKHNLANRLSSDQFCFIPPNQYVFPHAEYYVRASSPFDGLPNNDTENTDCSDSDSVIEVTSDDDDDDDDNNTGDSNCQDKTISSEGIDAESSIVIDSDSESKSKSPNKDTGETDL